MLTKDDLLGIRDGVGLDSLHPFMDEYYESRFDGQLPSFNITVDGVDVKENLFKLATNVPVSKIFNDFENRSLFAKLRDRWNGVHGVEIVVHTVFDKIQVMERTIFDDYTKMDRLEHQDKYKIITISYDQSSSRSYVSLRSEIYLLMRLLTLLDSNIDENDNLFSSIMFICEDFDENVGVIEIDLLRVLHMSRILENLHPSIIKQKSDYEENDRSSASARWGISDPNEPTDRYFYSHIKKLNKIPIEALEILSRYEQINADAISIFSVMYPSQDEACKMISAFDSIRDDVKHYGYESVCSLALKFGVDKTVQWLPKMKTVGIEESDIEQIVTTDQEIIDSLVFGNMEISWFRSFYSE